MRQFFVIPIVAAILLLVDYYVFQAVKVTFQDKTAETRKLIYGIYWAINAITLLGFAAASVLSYETINQTAKRFILIWTSVFYFSKLFIVLFLILDDLIRAFQWIYSKFSPPNPEITEVQDIKRSEFLMKSSLVVASVPIAVASFGILSGAHDYRVRQVKIKLPNLPSEFHGLKIGQLSDIHSGSFYNKTAVKGGVEMLIAQKPDLVFFTGDLVNNEASEMKNYTEVFGKITAPLGVYSVLGNHDYGDYIYWESVEAKAKNLQNLMLVQKQMGWNLLMNENKILEQKGEKIAIMGIENWSASNRFPKYGKLSQAHKGTEDSAVKLLLSHDPSHWRAEVLAKYPDIDLMMAGHTHGMQFGIDIGDFRWSPAQYIYPEWADLYQQNKQYLYVNRGFGYLGFPGRIGILPEITVFELLKG
ncbi:MAG: metallophosphoesterase [Bacteroidetes bacterium]|nr:MAG: metallophosphoesterase [Bacteroidota bacterium]